MGEPRSGLPALTSLLRRHKTRSMTAELLATQTMRRTPADVDLSEQFATAAIGHPGGRPWHVWPVDQGVEIRARGRLRAQAPGVGGQTVGSPRGPPCSTSASRSPRWATARS
jgi:hypothetical protein